MRFAASPKAAVKEIVEQYEAILYAGKAPSFPADVALTSNY